MLGLEARIDDVFVLVASQKQTRHDTQNQGNRNLPRKEGVRQSDPAATAPRTSRFFLQHFGNRNTGRPQCGHNAKYESSQNGDGECKHENRSVESQIREVLRVLRRAKRLENPASCVTK